MLTGSGELAFELADALVQFGRRHVVDRIVAAHAHRFLEVELAVLQLAHAGQAVAQRVEAVGLRLQFAQARGHGVDFLLGAAADLFEFGVLAFGLGLQ